MMTPPTNAPVRSIRNIDSDRTMSRTNKESIATLYSPSIGEITYSAGPVRTIRRRVYHVTLTRTTPTDSGASARNGPGCRSMIRNQEQEQASTSRTRMRRVPELTQT